MGDLHGNVCSWLRRGSILTIVAIWSGNQPMGGLFIFVEPCIARFMHVPNNPLFCIEYTNYYFFKENCVKFCLSKEAIWLKRHKLKTEVQPLNFIKHIWYQIKHTNTHTHTFAVYFQSVLCLAKWVSVAPNWNRHTYNLLKNTNQVKNAVRFLSKNRFSK